MYIGNSNQINNFNPTMTDPVTDSAYSVVWSGKTLKPESTYAMSSSYGVKANSEQNLIAGNSYSMDDQYIHYECTTNTYMRINDLAKNSYTDNMYADFKRLIEFSGSLKVSERKSLETMYSSPPHNLTGDDLTKAVDKQISDETAVVNAALHDRFNNMLYLHERHSAEVTTEHTQLGSRMLRMELLQTRLEEDENAYTKLMSENEDTNMAYAIMQKVNAEAAYQAALRANSNIMQLSLANYI